MCYSSVREGLGVHINETMSPGPDQDGGQSLQKHQQNEWRLRTLSHWVSGQSPHLWGGGQAGGLLAMD